MTKVGHTPEFLFGISWWNYLLKKLLKWTNKKCKYLQNIYKNIKNNKKKIKKNTWRYHYFIPIYQQSSWYNLQFLRYRVWHTEIGNHGEFFAFLKFWRNEKNCWRSFYTSVPKTTMIWGTVPTIQNETDRIFCHFGSFLPFYPTTDPKNKNLEYRV